MRELPEGTLLKETSESGQYINIVILLRAQPYFIEIKYVHIEFESPASQLAILREATSTEDKGYVWSVRSEFPTGFVVFA